MGGVSPRVLHAETACPEETLVQPARLADGLGIKVNPVQNWIRPKDWVPRFIAMSNRRYEFGLPDKGTRRVSTFPAVP